MIPKESRAKAKDRIEQMRDWVREDTELFVSVQQFLVAIGKSKSPRRELVHSFSDTCEEAEESAKLIVELAMTCLAMLSLDIMAEENAKMN